MAVEHLDRVLISPLEASEGFTAQHHDFPEIRTQAESPSAAAQALEFQLQRALDTALTPWRRETVENAIADVKAFMAHS